ncbi:hypothetical protein E2C01_080120 [Portunus trituberculatus]|uniref:Uncharacterized protein n=1 Tax=Portunus trituberculatus TaxID=210409 RepID=A0A5B7ILB9_PORTR|nr:hypothetical protein [Portunus trituberculatus]
MVPPITDSIIRLAKINKCNKEFELFSVRCVYKEAQCDYVLHAATLALSPGLLTVWPEPQTQSVAQKHVI